MGHRSEGVAAMLPGVIIWTEPVEKPPLLDVLLEADMRLAGKGGETK